VKQISLKQARKKARLTQEQLEASSGVSQSQISKLEAESDPNPTIDTVERLETALRRARGLRRDARLKFGADQAAVV
jgi:transcriptional regulator with XRE-family HTH domain